MHGDSIQAQKTRTMLYRFPKGVTVVSAPEDFMAVVAGGIPFPLQTLFCNHYTNPMLIPMPRPPKKQKIICKPRASFCRISTCFLPIILYRKIVFCCPEIHIFHISKIHMNFMISVFTYNASLFFFFCQKKCLVNLLCHRTKEIG